MFLFTTIRNILIAGILISVAACGSSNSDNNQAPASQENADLPESETQPSVDSDAESQKLQDDEIETSGSAADSGSSNSTPDDTNNPAPDDTDNPAPDDTNNTAPGDTDNTTPPPLPGDLPPLPPFPNGSESEVVDNPDMETPPVSDAPASPAVVPGSDLDRMIQGLTRQASITLLELNRRFMQGEEISVAQDKCLGTYEPSEGNSLLQIDCGERTGPNGEVLLGGDNKPKLEYLATGEIPIYVNSAAFYNTAECSSALLAQATENCVLETISLMIRSTLTSIPPPPAPGSPGHQVSLNFPGAIIEYAIGDSSIRINNLFPPINGIFSCEIDIETTAQSDSVITGSCPTLIKQMADQIDVLQAVE